MGVPRQVLAVSACATLAVTAVLSARGTEAGRPRLAAAANGAVLGWRSFNISGVNGTPTPPATTRSGGGAGQVW